MGFCLGSRPRALCLGGLLAFAPVIAAAKPVTSDARIESGKVRGVAQDRVVAFKGIPFAAPPVGPLRWRAPQPPAAWQGVRDASSYGHDCMQLPFPSDAAPLGTPPAEDCLYMNVWRPEASTGPLPVLVWIYGGGFVNGGSSPPTYAGDALARQGIVFVSFNYRLGRFGTFAHPQLGKVNADGGRLGNYGYMDQIAALQWVQRNIAAFGGDPRKVTIIGESAGGMSVHALLTSPLTRGLFSKAVIQSGGNGAGMAPTTMADAQAAGIAFASSKAIAADDPGALEKLRALSADDVTDGLNLAALFRGEKITTNISPFPDGIVAVDAAAAYAADRFHRVPVMVGATSDDIGGPDGFMIKGAHDVAAMLARKGVPTWHYRYSYVAESLRTPATKGAGHASEIPYFFNTIAIKYGDATTARDRAASTVVSHYLVNFVKTGNPNGTGLPRWNPTSKAGDSMMDFAADGNAMPRLNNF